MRVTKCYCDMCGKEIEKIADTQTKHIPIKKIYGKHGLKTTKIAVMDTYSGGNYLDFCDDCKQFIASAFEYRMDVTRLKKEINKIFEESSEDESE